MDTRTGQIGPYDEMERTTSKRFLKEIRPQNLRPHQQVILREKGRVKIGRNDPCPCGSEKKFKRCCLKNGASNYQKP